MLRSPSNKEVERADAKIQHFFYMMKENAGKIANDLLFLWLQACPVVRNRGVSAADVKPFPGCDDESTGMLIEPCAPPRERGVGDDVVAAE